MSEKKISKLKHTRLRFYLEKLKGHNALETFQAMISGKFAPLTIMNDEDADMDLMTTAFNTAVIETASEILGKHRHRIGFTKRKDDFFLIEQNWTEFCKNMSFDSIRSIRSKIYY